MEDEARIIDYNEIIAAKIAELSQTMYESMEEGDEEGFSEGFSEGLNPEQVSALLGDESENVIKAEPVYDGPSPDELIAQAQEDIEAMIADATQEAEQIRRNAFDEGQNQGYRDGMSRADSEIANEKARLNQEYAQMEAQLTAVYQQKLEEIEPALIDALTNIYEHIFDVKLSDNRDIIVHLIGNALRKADSSSEYLIHVSADDLPFVSMHKDALIEAGGITNASVEFIEDITLKKNQCIVECDGGIYDCSLGVELKELKKQLLLLSYDGIQRS